MNSDIKEILLEFNNKFGCVASCDRPNTKYYYIYKAILDFTIFLPLNTKFKDRIYYFLNDLTQIKKCKCGCSQDVKHPQNDYIVGHSNRCNAVKTKKIQTYLQKYGTTNPSKNNDIKLKKQTTFIKNFGTTHYMKSDRGIKINEDSNLLKYGVKNVFLVKTIQHRIKNTKIAMQKDITNKTIKTNREIFFDNILNRLNHKFIPLFTKEIYVGVGNKKYDFKCVKCGEVTQSNLDNGQVPRCYTCNPLINTGGQSIEEKELIDYIKNLTTNMLVQNRKEIYPLELDIYIPEKKLAIEFNGLYWHSETAGGKQHTYHLNKTNECNNKNIRLIHIFEDEWLFKKKIVKYRLKHILGMSKYNIFARKCEIKEIFDDIKNKFLNKYHIQGEDRCNKNIGLFYKNKLVSLMTFSKLRKALGQKHIDNNWELSRFCSVNNFNVIGGASKLLTYFEKTYKPIVIKSYSDKRWNVGKLYTTLGFKLDHESRQNYWYIDKTYQKRLHRFNFRKNVLKDKLDAFDPKLSEWQNMKNSGYDRIWDCGNFVFIKQYSN